MAGNCQLAPARIWISGSTTGDEYLPGWATTTDGTTSVVNRPSNDSVLIRRLPNTSVATRSPIEGVGIWGGTR